MKNNIKRIRMTQNISQKQTYLFFPKQSSENNTNNIFSNKNNLQTLINDPIIQNNGNNKISPINLSPIPNNNLNNLKSINLINPSSSNLINKANLNYNSPIILPPITQLLSNNNYGRNLPLFNFSGNQCKQ